MGKIYDEIQKEINNINIIGNKDDLKSLIAKDLSISKLNHLFSLIDKYYEDNNPNLIHKKFSIDDKNELEFAIAEAEAFIGKDETKILNDYHNLNVPDLSFLDNSYNNGYDHFLVLDTTVKETLKLHYKNNNNDNIHEAPKEILIAFQKEANDIMNNKEYKSQMKSTDGEYQLINEFINRPARSTVNGYRDVFKFENDEEKINFIRNVDNIVKQSANNEEPDKNADFSILNFINNRIKPKGINGAEELSTDVLTTIKEYIEHKDNMKRDNPVTSNKIPSVGAFLFKLKERVAYIAASENMMLGVDRPSEFLKNFLENPIDGLTKFYDARIEDYENRNEYSMYDFDGENGNNFDELIRKNQVLKEKIGQERNNYNRFAENKRDNWKQYQEYKSTWFMNHFKTWSNNKMINEALENNKGGFFENLFGTTSKEYKEFARGLEGVMTDGTAKGDLEGLRKLAQNYLTHKLKYYDVALNGYHDKEIENLDSTAKGRVNLCLTVIQAIDDAERSIANEDDPDEYVAPNLDDEQAHDEYWKQPHDQFMKNIQNNEDFLNNLKNDSEIEKTNDKLNEAILDIDPKDIEDVDIEKQ